MSGGVHPDDVERFRARLEPAFAQIANVLDDVVSGPDITADWRNEARALRRDWLTWCRRPIDWRSAPDVLESGRDLEARLAILQGPESRYRRGGRGGSTVGTLFGLPTVGELADLLAAKKKEVTEIRAAWTAAHAAWTAADAPAADAFARDIAAADARFDAAASSAQGVIAVTPDAIAAVVPIATPPGEERSTYAELVEASKPYVDLFVRLKGAGHAPAPYIVPQPKSADADLGVYEGADTLAHGVERAAKAVADTGRDVLPIVAVAGAVGLLVLLGKR
jgi:hypothetical protein